MKKTILVVDFERESIEEIRKILQSEDFRLLTASDGNEALSVFESAVPDLVLSAALLPKLNGFELSKKVTSGELGESRPVILYSAIYKAEKYRKEAMTDCGALEFLEKPIPKWRLLKVIKSVFSEIPIGSATNATQTTQRVSGSKGMVLALDELTGNNPGEAESLLEIDGLFETPRTASEVLTREVQAVLSDPLPLGKPPSVISNIDTAEIEAAVDAFRIDLNKEVRERDNLFAQQFEKELQEGGQGILELEAALGTGTPDYEHTVGREEAEVFELDGIELGATAVDSDARPRETPFQSLASEESPSDSLPQFSIKSTESKNWLPLIILVAASLLAGLFFWLNNG
jgi:CheY-like chemotaxis protein